ncbi:MAG: TlpA family protein disulfide reductase [Phycisphaerales bacterium]|nr:TlpA family protein disulfide reductase [Phycisphaerales bacterium]
MKFADDNKAHQDKFEIITVHDTSAKSLADLDEKLKKVEERSWGGKKLPFPIILDNSGQTLRAYGVQGFPTLVVIDPDGKVAMSEVGARGGSEKFVEEQLKKSEGAKANGPATTQPAADEVKPAPTPKPAEKPTDGG